MSTDCPNSQGVINISKHKYFLMYDKIQNKKVDVEAKLIKGIMFIIRLTEWFLRCTVHNIQKEI